MKKYSILRKYGRDMKRVCTIYAVNKKAAIAQAAYNLSLKLGISYSSYTDKDNHGRSIGNGDNRKALKGMLTAIRI